MIKRKERTAMWVHQDFKKMLKKKAIDEGVPVTDLTEFISDVEIDLLKKEKKK